MIKGNGFFEDRFGNKSSSRLVGFISVIYALLQSTLILYFGHIEGATVVATAAASSANFVAIAGLAMIYLYGNKKTENENGHSK